MTFVLLEHTGTQALFVANTRSCTIMGGVLPFDESIESDGDWLQPDTAHNNEFCRESAALCIADARNSACS